MDTPFDSGTYPILLDMARKTLAEHHLSWPVASLLRSADQYERLREITIDESSHDLYLARRNAYIEAATVKSAAPALTATLAGPGRAADEGARPIEHEPDTLSH
jgi:hypothetical protein